MNNPKICVAICNYNHSKYLKQSIKSIVNQTYRDLDIVVIDDGSSDQKEVYSIVESFYDPRIRFTPLQKNLGKWNALNMAFSSTHAEICTSHDADDVSMPWRLEAQWNVMKNTNTLHNLCGFIHCYSEKDMEQIIERPEEVKAIDNEQVFKMVLNGFFTPGINHYYTAEFETAGVSAMFHKKIWEIGFRFLPPKMGIRTLNSEDSDFNCRVTLGLRNTSILMETPYLYRRNTSTNNEEK